MREGRHVYWLVPLQYAPTPGKLDIRRYSSGQPFVTLLPDRTGQCQYPRKATMLAVCTATCVYMCSCSVSLACELSYPSGRLALVVFAPYPGVLSYLVFEV